MKKMQLHKRLLSLVLTMALCLSLMGGMALGAAAEEAYHTVNGELYLPTSDLAGTASHNSVNIFPSFNDQHNDGGLVTNPTILMQAEGDSVEYNFDMADDVTVASLKLLITGGLVEVKPAGGEYVTLTAQNGSGFNRGAAIYTLDESNALAASDNKFTLRISYAGTTILNGLLIQTGESVLDSTWTTEAMGQSYLKHLHSVSSGVSRYFLNHSVPTLHIFNGMNVVFHYQLADAAEGATVSFAQAGVNPLTCEVSEDNSSWTAITSGTQVTHKDFYVRFTAAAGEAFLQSVTVAPKIVTWQQVKGEFYLPMNDLNGASDHSATGIQQNYNDQFHSGVNATNYNLQLTEAGAYVEYNFDLEDDVTTASLKLLLTGSTVSVKPYGSSTYTQLTAQNGSSFNRGTAIYVLDESNALSSADRKFTLRISYGSGENYLNGLLLQTETPVLESAYTLTMLSRNYLSALYSVSGSASRYFLGGSVPTLWIHSGEQATFHFTCSQEAEGAIVSFAQAGNALTTEVSADGTVWTAISSGSKVEYKDFYVRFTAAAGEAFLQSVTVDPVVTKFLAVEKSLYLPLDSLDNASDYAGSMEVFNDQYMAGDLATNNALLLKAEGAYVEYNFDLDDDVTEASLKLLISGGKVEVKSAGGEFEELTARNGAGFDRGAAIYTLDESNALEAADNKFTLRISYAGDPTIFNGLLIQTDVAVTSDIHTTGALGQSYLEDLYDVSAGATRYFLNQSIPTVYLHTGEHVTFRYQAAESTKAATVNFTQAGEPLTCEVSADGQTWTAIAPGDRVTEKNFYVRFTANNGDAFLQNVLINPEVIISSASLTLDGILKLTVNVDGEAASACTLQAVIGEDTATVSGAGNQYVISLPAHRMHEAVKLEVLYNGQVIDKQTWTMAAYTEDLSQKNPENEELLELLDAVNNYGTYAAYYAAPTGTAPDSETVEAVKQSDMAAYKMDLTTANAELKAVTALYLDDACDLIVKFNAAAFEGNKLLIDGQEVEVTTVGEQAIYRIENLLPQDWTKLYNIKVVNADGETVFEVEYSVLSYAYICLGRAQELKTGLNSLLKALYLYSKAAAAYQA